MNNKGFMMAEVVVVSSIVLVTLVGLYTSYNKIFSTYNQRVNYYDVATLYELANIRDNKLGSLTYGTSTLIDNNVVYYINKYDIGTITTTGLNTTFKEYLVFLAGALEVDDLTYAGSSVNNILVMESCSKRSDSDIYDENCKYAYLEVPDLV